MSLIGFIRSVEESRDKFDVELEKFDVDSEQEAVDDDTSGGRPWGRLLLIALLLVGAAYAVSQLRSSPDDSFTDIALADDPAEGGLVADEETSTGNGTTDNEDTTVTAEHSPEAGVDDAAADDGATEVDGTSDANDKKTDADDDDVVEVEIGLPDGDEE